MSEISDAYLNLLRQKRMQGELQTALSPILEKAFDKAFGADWLQKLNDDRKAFLESRGRSSEFHEMGIHEGRPTWDTTEMLANMRTHWKQLSLRTKKGMYVLRPAIAIVLNVRNGVEHTSAWRLEAAAGKKPILEYADAVCAILDDFNLGDAVRRVNEIANETLTIVVGKPEAVEEAKPAILAADPAPILVPDLAVLAPVSGREVTQRRNPTRAAPKSGVVYFPLASMATPLPPDEQCIGVVTCTLITARGKNDIRDAVQGFEDEAAARQLLSDTRIDEPDSGRNDLPVRARIDPSKFGGNSFGLAVAIADRGLRYGLTPEMENTGVLATGVVIKNRGGAIGAIDHFHEKIAIAAEHMSAGSIFVFPAVNLDKEPHLRADLDRLAAKGIRYLAVSHIDDLNDWFNMAEDPAGAEAPVVAPAAASVAELQTPIEQPRPAPRRKFSGSIAALVLAGPVVFVGFVFLVAPMLRGGGIDLASRQASETRIATLVRAAQVVTAAGYRPRECDAAGKALQAIEQGDRSQFSDQATAAETVANQCVAMLADHRAHLDDLAVAASNYDPAISRSVEVMAEVRQALSRLDLAGPLTAAERGAIALGDKAAALIAESDVRLGRFKTAAARWSGDVRDVYGISSISRSFEALTEFDTSRAPAPVAEDIEKARAARRIMETARAKIEQALRVAADMAATGAMSPGEASAVLDALTPDDLAFASGEQRSTLSAAARSLAQRRVDAFIEAAKQYRQRGNAEDIAAVTSAFSALTATDLQDFASALSPYRDAADAARTKERDALDAISRLQDRVAAYQRDKAAGEAEGSELASILNAIDALTAFETDLIATRTPDLLVAMEELKAEILSSDRRLGELGDLADLVRNAPDNRVGKGTIRRIKAVIGELTDFDRSRMTDDQRDDVSAICAGGPLPDKPNLAPAMKGFICE